MFTMKHFSFYTVLGDGMDFFVYTVRKLKLAGCDWNENSFIREAGLH